MAAGALLSEGCRYIVTKFMLMIHLMMTSMRPNRAQSPQVPDAAPLRDEQITPLGPIDTAAAVAGSGQNEDSPSVGSSLTGASAVARVDVPIAYCMVAATGKRWHICPWCSGVDGVSDLRQGLHHRVHKSVRKLDGTTTQRDCKRLHFGDRVERE